MKQAYPLEIYFSVKIHLFSLTKNNRIPSLKENITSANTEAQNTALLIQMQKDFHKLKSVQEQVTTITKIAVNLLVDMWYLATEEQGRDILICRLDLPTLTGR